MSDVRIAPTAHYTAYVWYRLKLPHGELFRTDTGRRLFWTFRAAGEWVAAAAPGIPSMAQYLELRHRAIEHVLEEIAPDRIVEIGAGLSRRGLTWAADRAVTYTEVDLPHMVEAKREALARAPSALKQKFESRLRHAALDVLSDELAPFLERELADAQRPVVIAEGLLGYFALPERAKIVRAVASALGAVGGGTLLCDLRSGEGGRAIAVAAKLLRGAIWIATRGRGARQDFPSADAVRAFLLDAGFSVAEPVAVERATPHLAHLRSPARVWRATL